MPSQVLVIDLDLNAAETLRDLLTQNGKIARVVYDSSELRGLDIEMDYPVVFVDPAFPKINGMDIVDYVRIKAPHVKLVVLTDKLEAPMKERWRRKGAWETLKRPYSERAVKILLNEAFADIPEDKADFAGMIGGSRPMKALYDIIRSIAETDSSALILGETGVGKELVAGAIHSLSRRKHRKFVTINCGALAESILESELFGHEKGAYTGAIKEKAGKFEYADGGTVFLDEIGEVSPNVQVKLLKVIETGEVERLGSNRIIKTNTRMLFATNRDLDKEAQKGRFRRDLYYRINIVPIHVPSLNERIEDIPPLVNHFLRFYSIKHERKRRSISPEAMKWLMDRKWEGNVRELENSIERGVIVSSGATIGISDFTRGEPSFVDDTVGSLDGLDYREMTFKVMAVYEKLYLTNLLAGCGGNISRAARRAGLDRKTLYDKLSKQGIDPSMFRKGENE